MRQDAFTSPVNLQGRVQASPGFGGGFGLWPRVIVAPFGLEKYGVFRVPPEMCDWVTTVATAGQHFQAAAAFAIGARFSYNKVILFTNC